MHVDSDACAACAKCLNICPLNLIRRRAFDVVIEEGCIDCKVCQKVCPCGAILDD